MSTALDTSHSTVLRWRLPREKGGTGGVIPHWHHTNLRSIAKGQNLELTLADFVPLEPASVAP